MKIEELINRLEKKATIFSTGGFKPTNSISESWIGKIYLFGEEEEIPKDENGELMYPVFQLCIDGLPFIPDTLKDTKVITVFISANLPMGITPNGNNWLLREYKKSDNLIIKELHNPESPIKPFPLAPQFLEKDYPVWDSGDISREIADKILELENSGEISDYYDYTENDYRHKLGGYASFCQSGIDWGDGFEFVFQISSDEKAMLNIVDSGTIFLAKNKKTGEWKYYCDFY